MTTFLIVLCGILWVIFGYFLGKWFFKRHPKFIPAIDDQGATEKQEEKSMDKQTALETVSSSLGIPSKWLDDLIKFESAWNPAAKNPISGAQGLIQFTNTTAQVMGYKDAGDLVSKFPDSAAQLMGPVYVYLSKYKPFPTAQSLYMAVFYPAARNWSPETAFSSAIQALNPGIKTVADYIKKVEKADTGIKIAVVLMSAVAAYFIYTHFFKGVDAWEQEKNPITIVKEVN